MEESRVNPEEQFMVHKLKKALYSVHPLHDHIIVAGKNAFQVLLRQPEITVKDGKNGPIYFFQFAELRMNPLVDKDSAMVVEKEQPLPFMWRDEIRW